MRTHKYIRDVRKQVLKNIELFIDIKEINDEHHAVLQNCVLIKFAPKQVKALCTVLAGLISAKQEGKEGPDRFRSITNKERSIIGMIELLNKLSEYRFGFMGGGMGETFTVYAVDHKEAWNLANEHATVELQGIVRMIYCLQLNGEDTGVLHNMSAMFTPKIKNQVNSIKADDLLPEWKDYKG